MKRTKTLKLMTRNVSLVFSIYLILQSSFFLSATQGNYVNCASSVVHYVSNSKILEEQEIECPTCELVNARKMYNSEGGYLGILYEYDLGSEPVIREEVSCEYSSNEFDSCKQQVHESLGYSCPDDFVPCTKEEDAECVSDDPDSLNVYSDWREIF